MLTLTAPAPYVLPATVNTAPARLAESLRWLRHHNIPFYNAQVGSLPLLGDNEVNAYPLVGRFIQLPKNQLTAADATSCEAVTVTAGTQVLALSIDLTQREPRVLVDALSPQGRSRKLYLTARQLELASGEATGHTLLGDICTRLRLLQDVRVA